MLLCEHCIEAIRSRGEIVGVFEPFFMSVEECETDNITCEWCGEFDELFKCELVTE